MIIFAIVMEKNKNSADATWRQRIDALRRGEWTDGFGPEIARMLRQTECMCHRYNQLSPDDDASRRELLDELLGSVGRDVLVHSPFRCDFGSMIRMGDNVTANYGLTILDEAEVSIGNRVFIGPNVNIYTITHALLPDQRMAGIMRALPVTVADDAWIGGNVTLLPGVTIGRGAVIGAASVVTADIPPMTLAFGNPCRPVRAITEADRIDYCSISV